MKEALQGKVAIITGSGRGIGKAVALTFVKQGAKVTINDIDPNPCEETVKEIQDMGGEALSCPCDVTNKEQVEKMVADTLEKFGKIDILINNAGVTRDAMIHKMTDQQMKFVIDVNLKGTHVCSQAVIPHFLEPERHDDFKKIVNFTSVTGASGNVGQSNYAIAKGGIIAYTKSLARELGRDRVCVNAIAPGFVETRMTQEKKPGMKLGIPLALRKIMINSIPFARNETAAQPEDMADIVIFLASKLSDWVSGQIIIGDGASVI